MRFFADADYKFIEKRKTAYVVSSAVIGLGLLAMLFNVFSIGSWQNYGVDFTGGSLVQVRFHQPTTAGQVREALGGASAPQITPFDQDAEFVIRASLAEGQEIDDLRAGIELQLTTAFGPGTFDILRAELVSAKIGAELETKAGLAILFSFALTLVYVAIRFQTRFGVAAVIATLHDTLITLGFLAIFRVEIALPTVAAILTIVGYSLNDTIVVFDRIRENLGKKGARKIDQIALIDRSINETLPRTVLTSGTTLLVLLSLLILGPVVIRDFALVLTLGILVGTYSSIFVASPALVEIRRRFGEGNEREKKPRPQPATV